MLLIGQYLFSSARGTWYLLLGKRFLHPFGSAGAAFQAGGLWGI